MATVTMPDKSVQQGVRGTLLDYYRGEINAGEDYTIVLDDADGDAVFPQRVGDDHGDLPAEGDPGEQTHPGTGEQMTGVEVAPGETGEISNSPEPGEPEAPLPGSLDAGETLDLDDEHDRPSPN